MSETPTYHVTGEIRAVMARKRITQTALAAQLGLPAHLLARRLSNHVALTVDELAAIAAALEVPVTDLLPAETVA
jgi:transcriptional regulator with XRE-family HTH domain